MNAKQTQQWMEMQDCLQRCLEYLEQHFDIVDSPSGPRPNDAMRLATEIKEALGILP
jgi:hypothetical protein